MRLYREQPPGTVDRARDLRRRASEPERCLLRELRTAFPDLKWRHQVPLGPFYVDILCFSKRLIIEVDGDEHALKVKQDAGRSRFLKGEGYRVVRFGNADVMGNLKGVVTAISLALAEARRGRP